MVNNYNLIYGLGFSPDRIAVAVENSVTERKSEKNQHEIVSIDSLLTSLISTTRK